MQPRVAGVLLAAGEGSRLGRPKALVEVGGRRLADRGVALLRAGGAGPVVLVAGAAAVAVPGAVVVHNPAWPAGLGSSLAAGLAAVRALPGQACGAAVIALADQPLVGPGSVRPADRRAPRRGGHRGRRLRRAAAQPGADRPRALG